MSAERPSLPPIRPAEGRALAVASEIASERILCTTAGRAQAAGELARERNAAEGCCWFIDDYQRQLAVAA